MPRVFASGLEAARPPAARFPPLAAFPFPRSFRPGYDSFMSSHNPARRVPRWLWIPIIWLGFGLFDATQAVIRMRAEGMHHNWARLFFMCVISWAPWALETVPLMRLNRRYPVTNWRSGHTWRAHIPALLLCNVVLGAWYALFEHALNPYNLPHPRSFGALFWEDTLSCILASALLYGAIVAVDTVLDSRARLARQQAETARLNEQLSHAQLDAVRRQIEPHFLFNTLNSVSALIREGRNDAAVTMIAGLSDFLRRLLAGPALQQVALAEEMDFAQRYLDIQKVRFADRLQLSLDVPADLLVAQVPTLVLQLMLENAIKHGIAKRAQGGMVRIAAARNNGTLTLSVYNDGPAITSSPESNCGIGLTNMRTRLQGLYGDRFALDMQNRDPDGVEVSVSVPFIEH
jgi:two-component sensor histidine kinase